MGYPVVLSISTLDSFLSAQTRSGSDTPSSDIWVRLNFPDKADGARPEVGRDNGWKFSHPYHEPVPANLANNMLLQQRYPDLHFHDLTPFMDAPAQREDRGKKSKWSGGSGRSARKRIRMRSRHARPGMFQYQIEALAYYEMFDKGAQGAVNIRRS